MIRAHLKQGKNPKHIVSIKDLDKDFIAKVFSITKDIKKDPLNFKGLFFNKVFATIFYEPSTRTRLSFESAINRLGGRVISVENAKDNSSVRVSEFCRWPSCELSGYFIVFDYQRVVARHSVCAREFLSGALV